MSSLETPTVAGSGAKFASRVAAAATVADDATLDAGRAGRELRSAAIVGLGHALGDDVVGNAEVSAAAGVAETWIVKRTGVRERREATSEQSTETLAAQAGARALADAGVEAADLDLVICATFTSSRALPHAAPIVANAIGAHGAGAFDVGSACSGFLTALLTGSAMIETGRAERILVVGADTVRRTVDRSDKGTAPLFADGAGAVVLVAGQTGGVVRGGVLHADGSGGDLIEIPPGGTLTMVGHETFIRAVASMSGAATEVCEAAGVALSDIDLVVPHQANSRIAQAISDRLGLADGVMVDDIAHVGNTSAGTLPIALDRARQAGRLPADGLVLLAAFASGLTWGAALIEWRSPA